MRYPVKSMRGEELSTATIDKHGFAGDREYAFVIGDAPNPRLPWMTARHASGMLLYKAKTMFGTVEVESPCGVKYLANDERLERELEEKYGYQISLKQSESGCHDSKPVSILGLQSIKQLGQEMGFEDLALERFRANIYADWTSGMPFLEDSLVGSELKVGKTVVLNVVKKDSRCVIPTLDPTTACASPIVLERIKSSHGGFFGVYAEVAEPGDVKKDDDISLI